MMEHLFFSSNYQGKFFNYQGKLLFLVKENPPAAFEGQEANDLIRVELDMLFEFDEWIEMLYR